MDSRIITNKRISDKINLSDKTFELNPDAHIIDIIEMKDPTDLNWYNISFKYYGTAEYWDGLCRFNGYSDPFLLNVGDDILIPSYNAIHGMYLVDNTNNVFKDTFTKTPISKESVDNNRQQFLDNKNKIPTANNGSTTITSNNDGTITLAK